MSDSVNTAGFLWVEEGERNLGPVAEVAPILRLDRTYSFTIPPHLVEDLKIGQRVRIPLRKSGVLVPGFVVQIAQRPWDSTLRAIDSIVDTESFLTPTLIELGRQISGHYACPLGQTLKAMTPEAARAGRGLVRIRYVQLAEDFNPGTTRLSRKGQAVVDLLRQSGEPLRLEAVLLTAGVSGLVVRRLHKAAIVNMTIRVEPDESRLLEPAVVPFEPDFELNEEQVAALAEIHRALDDATFRTLLLFGVSGAGKTEVYIQAIRRAAASGRQAILLVPEIVLTTQLAGRLAARFDCVAVQHSGLTEAQRSLMWRQIAAGEKSVVIGTRSAVFAPCPNLGLILVDEEQENSYKNMQVPRFHVRDVAIMRARQLGIPVVLGSATPSLESWHRSQTRPDYRLVQLTRRVKSLPMPRVHVVDMRDELIAQKKPVLLSRLFDRLLAETLDRSEQALILMNRRGFAHRIFCPQCKTRVHCPQCSVGLVVHTTTGQSICHYCRTGIETPTHCPQLGCGAQLLQMGTGTQKIEQVLASRFPRARIQRVDSDTLNRREQYERLVANFEGRHIDILVGTQMIAKGLDFPHVSFVGMINADSEGFAADFRAHERLFQLVTQVAGRAGRADAPGQVVVQTIAPEMPALSFALAHDYPGFAKHELAIRRRTGFPPFRRLVRFVLNHARDETAHRAAGLLHDRVLGAIETLKLPHADVLGPGPCPIARIRGRYRHDVLVRTETASDLRTLMDHLRRNNGLRVRAAALTIDVDPVSLV